MSNGLPVIVHTLKEVRTAARELIRPDRLIWVIVGDLSRCEDDVRKLGIGEAVEIDVFGQRVEADAHMEAGLDTSSVQDRQE